MGKRSCPLKLDRARLEKLVGLIRAGLLRYHRSLREHEAPKIVREELRKPRVGPEA